MERQSIRLLDGSEWAHEEIVKEMESDTFYYEVLNTRALSSSACKPLMSSANEYMESLSQKSDSPAFREGRLVHMAILEPHKMNALHIVNVKSRKTKTYTEAVEEHGYYNVYTMDEYNLAMRCHDAVHNSEATHLITDCKYEVPEIKMIEDIPFRAKADAIDIFSNMIVDLKTTSTSVKKFQFAAKNYSYALQAYLYKTVFEIDNFWFLVVNKNTLDVGIFECSDEFFFAGAEMLETAIKEFKDKIIWDNGYPKVKEPYVIKGIL